MKNRFKSIVVLSVTAACVLSVLVFALLLHAEERNTPHTEVGTKAAHGTTVLLAGVDDAGANTDMLMLLSTSGTDGSIRMIQIPRDTYLKTDGSEGKINHIYRTMTSKYGTKNGAEKFSDTISQALGVSIDAYAVLSTSAVEALVDAMGGITVNIPHPIEYYDSASGTTAHLAPGKQHLDGKEALHYVRHRASYLEGDLGRLDAQMRFISAMFSAIPSLKFPKQYLSIYQKIAPNLLTNLSEKDIINLIMVYLKNRDNISVEIMRMPGEACRGESGGWYYVLNRDATERMLAYCFALSKEFVFDASMRFTREDRETFMNIYNARAFKYRVYTLDEAANMEVLPE